MAEPMTTHVPVRKTQSATAGSPTFDVEQEVGPEGHTAEVRLSRATTESLVTDLVGFTDELSRLRDLRVLARRARREGRRAASIEARHEAASLTRRIAASMSAAVLIWHIEPDEADELADALADAATQPDPCLVGTCTGLAAVSGYCPAHAERL